MAAALGVAANDFRLGTVRASALQHSSSASHLEQGKEEEQGTAAAIAAAAASHSFVTPECAQFVGSFVGSRDLETAVCASMVDAGARDGVTVRFSSFVDVFWILVLNCTFDLCIDTLLTT